MKKYSILIILFVGMFYACQDDFLTIEEREAILTSDGLANTDDGAKAIVTAVYAKYLDYNLSSFSWIGITSITTDDADKGSDPTDAGTDKNLLDNLDFTPSSESFKDVWKGSYEAINRANYAIEQLPFFTGADAGLRARLDAEARFLRAFTYFNLIRLYGAVPLVDHVVVPSNPDDKQMARERKSVNEIYTFIEQELSTAIANLPDRTAYGSADKGRVSKGSALALMAKVKLYRQQWSEVVSYANQISGYSLTPNYAEIFKVSGEFNQESLFEINGWGSDPARGIHQYSLTQGARGSGGWGWGFNIPSASLLGAYEPNDTRKAATVIFAGQTLYDGRVVSATANNPYYNYKAYSPNNGNPGANDTDTNIRYLRYAEVLLMKAEALNELNDLAGAKTELNKVRNRAGLANTTASTKDDVRLAIWKERRVELAFEHDRWFDLIRTGQAQQALADHGKTFVVGKHELFPIPQNVIDESEGVTSQNPNY